MSYGQLLVLRVRQLYLRLCYIYYLCLSHIFLPLLTLPEYRTPTNPPSGTKLHRFNLWATGTFNHGLYNKKSILSSNLENYGIAILLVLGSATRQLDVRYGPPMRFT